MDDPFGILPADIRARYERAEWVDGAAKAGRELERELKGVFGPEIEVVLVKANIDPENTPENVIPGRWHVRRNNPPPTLPTYIPITTPDGGYRDPDSNVLAELADIDLTRPGVKQRMMDRTRSDSPHKQRERDLKKEQRHDELKLNFRAAKRVAGDGGLTKRKFYPKKVA